MSKIYGTENIKKVISFGLGLATDIQAAGEDGHYNLKDAPLFLDDVVKIPGIIKAAPQLKKEFTDLDAAEREEIKEWVKNEYDCPDDKVEDLVEKAFAVAIDASQMVQDIIALAEAIKALKALKKAQNAE